MRQVAQSLQRGHAMEVNFATMKFMELPDAERRRLYDAFKSEDEKTRVRAAFEILKLLTDAPEGELTQYASSVLEINITEYFVSGDQENLVSRAIWLDHHFTANLKLEGDRVSIDPVPVRAPAQ
ncbi:MAG: hypothetical protein A3F20_01465 [Candidatus Zambryskibacteria bacterium RIFCSPHIGHO2_12_FULL_39_21]|nr:MAG: hypothetical protein A3B88_01490 [Candidatus Zambryskibacteria bacterium RIFCSPHIGHO2_02_FULL_39_19]OHA97868.1 MAG: hypothetical protein A3F20_01465 [Candidatus Zambryskibacteria bacterium RIFCSPHIGHO2_12_FULL_39_21]